ncbi:MAG: response regulator [Candidatus Dadabacteria bacterium]|nr:MAG: response regulator [Candidatus Dadabacteria bacterium]
MKRDERRPRALVADDEPTTRILIRATLEHAGFAVVEAPDGEAAWDAFAADPPDLVLLDVRMPGIDGLTLCKRIRQHPEGPAVPVVVITDRDDQEALAAAFDAGATDFLGKPLSWRLLGHRIRHVHRASRAFRRVAESERRLRALVDALPDLLLRIDADGTYRDASAPREFPLADEARRAVGQRVGRAGPLPPDALALVQECAATGQGGHLEFEVERDGRRHVFEARFAPASGSEVLAVVRDITHEAELERQLAVSQKLQALGVLAGGIAHELNNLLQPILGYADLVAGKLPPDSREAANLHKLTRAAERARDLVARVLAFGRDRPRAPRVVDLADVVREAAALMEATLPANIEVSFTADPHARATVFADPTELHQVVLNLCTNAAHAIGNREGRIEIRLLAPTEAGDGPAEKPHAVLVVKDTGDGIPPELQHRVFEPFFTTKPPGQGTGLGLALVHSVATACGGQVTLRSHPGQGAEFRLSFPVADGPAEATAPRPPARPHPAPPTPDSAVLFVDDEPTIRELAAEALEEAGFRVLTAGSLAEARALLDRPDLAAAVLDQTLPDGRGTAFLSEIWARHPGLPVVLCTGFDPELGPEKAAALGLAGFAWKPLRTPELVELVREALEGKG